MQVLQCFHRTIGMLIGSYKTAVAEPRGDNRLLDALTFLEHHGIISWRLTIVAKTTSIRLQQKAVEFLCSNQKHQNFSMKIMAEGWKPEDPFMHYQNLLVDPEREWKFSMRFQVQRSAIMFSQA